MRHTTWKFKTALLIVAILIIVFIVTSINMSFNDWSVSILIPIILSIVTSAGVSLYFTIKTEKDRKIEGLEREISGIFQSVINMEEKMHTIALNPFYTAQMKGVQLQSLFSMRPDMFYIKSEFPKLYNLYWDNCEKVIREDLNQLRELSDKEFLEKFKSISPNMIWKTTEIMDETLKVQEMFRQKYRGTPKKEIKDQLIFHEGQENSK